MPILTRQRTTEYLAGVARPRILVIRFSSIGDIVQLSAAVDYLKRSVPGCTIEWLVKQQFADLVERMPQVDRVISYDKKTGLRGLVRLCRAASVPPYDLVCDMHAVTRSFLSAGFLRYRRLVRYHKPYVRRFTLFYLHTDHFPADFSPAHDFLAALEPGITAPSWFATRLTVSPADEQNAAALLKRHGCADGHAPVVFVCGAAWPQKRWPVEHWVELGRRIAGADPSVRIMVLGGPQDAHCAAIAGGIGAAAVDLHGTGDLGSALGLLAAAKVVIGHDTGLTHAAEALGHDVISILGPTGRQTGAFPLRPGSIVLERTMACRPCSQKGDRPCQLPRQDCLLSITAADAFGAYQRIIAAREERHA
jgi:ADP-heptose:LPS heptosyltransferase